MPMLRAVIVTIACALLLPIPNTARSDGGTIAAHQRAPKDGGVRRWEVNSSSSMPLRTSPAMNADVVLTLEAGDIVSNMGCTESKGQTWCSVRPFRGGPRGFVPAEKLTPATGPDGAIPIGPDLSRKRASKRKFDAMADIPCAQEQGQSLSLCKAAVARGDGGDATIVVTFGNGFSRKLYFVHGEFVSASATMSGVGRDTDWQLFEGLHKIRVDDQRFELPDTFVYGD